MPRPTRILIVVPLIGLALVYLTRTVLAQAPPAPLAAKPQVGDLNVLERGPIHEAFAEPIALDIDPADAPIIDRAPPEPIDELPPEVRPEGNNVQWLSGYWMFSVEQDDFIWISGVWREIPPGRQWVPGHWSKVPGGFQWVSGFWAADGQQEVQFLPQPPQTLEQGPISPAPSTSHFWIPGCWTWNQARYVWRPGYWYAGQAGWIWTPDHYVWTPRGFVYVAGYWDYPIARRGLLFAPVFWNSHHRWHTVRYTPRHVINPSLLLNSLFVHSPYRHYYFGYGGNYANFGLLPWYNVHLHKHRGHRHLYDPFYAYHRWHDGRRNPHWIDDYRRHFDGRHKGKGGKKGPQGNRIPDEIVLKGNGRGPKDKSVLQASTSKLNSLVMPLGQFASNIDTKSKLQRVSQQQQLDAIRGSDRVRNLARLRAQQEVFQKTTNSGKQKGSQFVRDTLRLPEKYQAGKPITTSATQRLRANTQAIGQGRPDLKRNLTTGKLESSQATQLRRQLELQSRGSTNQEVETNRRVGEQQQALNQFLRDQKQRLREQTRAGSPNTIQRSNTTRPLRTQSSTLGQPTNNSTGSAQPRVISGTPQNSTRAISQPSNWATPWQNLRTYQPQRSSSQRIMTSPSNRSGQSFPQQFRQRANSGQGFQRSSSQNRSSTPSARSSLSNSVQPLKATRSRLGK